MAIITISRELGSGGEEIAARVADKLGFSLVDKPQIEQFLKEYDLDEIDLDQIDERSPEFPAQGDSDQELYVDLIRSFIVDLAEEEYLVVLGRGGQFIFRDFSDTLHVRVTASWELRIKRIADAFHVGQQEAARLLRRSDRERAQYVHHFYQGDWADLSLYDLVLRTDRIELDGAVALIVRSAELFQLEQKGQSFPSSVPEMVKAVEWTEKERCPPLPRSSTRARRSSPRSWTSIG